MFRNFLEKLQSASNEKKKIWMILFTSIAMVIVVFLWLMYFNNLVASLSRPSNLAKAQPQDNATATKSRDFSFVETMKNSTAIVFGFLGDRFNDLVKIFEKPKEYIIKP